MIYINADMNVSYYYYSDYATGYDRLMAIAMMLNYYFSIPNSNLINDFTDFLSDLRKKYYDDNYPYDCFNKILISHGITPDSNPYVLYKYNRDKLPNNYTYSINGVFIYNYNFMKDAYKFASSNQAKVSKFYIEKCINPIKYV